MNQFDRDHLYAKLGMPGLDAGSSPAGRFGCCIFPRVRIKTNRNNFFASSIGNLPFRLSFACSGYSSHVGLKQRAEDFRDLFSLRAEFPHRSFLDPSKAVVH